VLSVQATGVAPVGFVSIQILVDQVTGNDMTVPHGEIPNVPYFRLQGGANAVIIDPKVGDIGMACFASRDISAVKNARQAAPPGSRRAHDFSDAMYIGGFLNGTPTQYIHFTDSGIVVISPHAISAIAPVVNVTAAEVANITAPAINVTGDLTVTGNTSLIGEVHNNGTNIGDDHKHAGSPTAPLGPVSNTGDPI
jgi:phage baseplate assembly protein gpV